jgi:hypothetical protein
LSATNTFTVIVNEVNQPPTLPVQSNVTIVGMTPLRVTNAASDPDLPANDLVYSLLSAPANVAIDTNGVITWTPAADQILSTNSITTVVTDHNPAAVNEQQLSATNTFIVVVAPVHNTPVLPAQTNISVVEPATLFVTNAATAHDIPLLAFSYELINPPQGAAIDQNGVITWTPDPAQAASTNIIETVVTDNPSFGPGFSATNSFLVYVEPLAIPFLQSIAISNGYVVLVWSAVPGRSYQLQSTPELGGTNWSDLLAPVQAGGPTATAIDTDVVSTQRFYRLLMLP